MKRMKKSLMSGIMLAMFSVSSAAVLWASLYSRSLVAFSMKEMENNIEGRLKETAKRGAALVTAEELSRYRSPDDMNTPGYQVLKMKLRGFAEDSGVLYVYYLRADSGQMRYIVDNDFDEATRVGLDTPPSRVADVPGLAEALDGRVKSPPLGSYMKDWEGLLSAYAPIFDAHGQVAAICGVDINDEMILEARNRTRLLWFFEVFSIMAVVASGLFCFAWYRQEARFAKEAGFVKSRLLSKISHEMRRPLTVMSVKARLVKSLLRGSDDPNAQKISEALDVVSDEAARLARMSDVAIALEIVQTGSGGSELDAGYLFRTTTEIYETLVERRGNRIAARVPDDLPHVDGDADGLSQVLINLISNANEHTENGEITVTALSDGQAV
ncbi:MAG: hypothetical protein LBT08_02405, partial [Synergistaceae bacterium]|nr:hypothetical protein [Synergistaceae bacterium]